LRHRPGRQRAALNLNRNRLDLIGGCRSGIFRPVAAGDLLGQIVHRVVQAVDGVVVDRRTHHRLDLVAKIGLIARQVGREIGQLRAHESGQRRQHHHRQDQADQNRQDIAHP